MASFSTEFLSGMFNLGKSCFVSSVIQCLSTLTDIRFEMIHHFKECGHCKESLKSRKLVVNGKYPQF